MWSRLLHHWLVPWRGLGCWKRYTRHMNMLLLLMLRSRMHAIWLTHLSVHIWWRVLNRHRWLYSILGSLTQDLMRLEVLLVLQLFRGVMQLLWHMLLWHLLLLVLLRLLLRMVLHVILRMMLGILLQVLLLLSLLWHGDGHAMGSCRGWRM